MDPFNTLNQKQKSKKTTTKATNFIEALKDLGSSVKRQAKDVTLGTSRGVVNQIFGTPRPPVEPQKGELSPDKPFNFEDFLKSRERQVAFREKQRYERRLREERMVYHRKEEEAKLQIKAIQEELKKLTEATKGLSQEVKKAVFTSVVEPGTYHLSFFDRIRRIIELARKQIAESKTWFETFNQRKKRKQSYYWFQVKKSGTKFMLSQERYMATQVG